MAERRFEGRGSIRPDGSVGSLRDELRELPPIQRWVVYLSIVGLALLLIQCFLIMPVILIKYGWGFDVGDGF